MKRKRKPAKRKYISKPKPEKEQEEISGSTDIFSLPPIASAPSKTPCWPLFDEPDARPPLPAYDTAPVLPGDTYVCLWRHNGRAIYERKRTRREPKCCPGFAWRAMIVAFIGASKPPPKARRRTPTGLADTFGAVGLQRDANRAWARKPKVFRRPFDRWDAPEPGWALKRQAETAELVAAFFAAGGSMAFHPTHREGKPMMEHRRIDLWSDCNDSWRVEMIDGDVADTVGYFVDFEQAQRFALAAAKLWRTELRPETKAA